MNKNNQPNTEKCCCKALTTVWTHNKDSQTKECLNNCYFVIGLSNGECSCHDTNVFQNVLIFQRGNLSAITKMASALVENITDDNGEIRFFLVGAVIIIGHSQTWFLDWHSVYASVICHIVNLILHHRCYSKENF